MQKSQKIKKAKELAEKKKNESLFQQIKIETKFIRNLNPSPEDRSDILNFAQNIKTNNQPY